MSISGNTKGGNTDNKKNSKTIKPLNSIKEDLENGVPKKTNTKNPAKRREESEQPVHSVKKAPKEQTGQ